MYEYIYIYICMYVCMYIYIYIYIYIKRPNYLEGLRKVKACSERLGLGIKVYGTL